MKKPTRNSQPTPKRWPLVHFFLRPPASTTTKKKSQTEQSTRDLNTTTQHFIGLKISISICVHEHCHFFTLTAVRAALVSVTASTSMYVRTQHDKHGRILTGSLPRPSHCVHSQKIYFLLSHVSHKKSTHVLSGRYKIIPGTRQEEQS